MQTNSEFSFIHFTPEIFTHFNLFLPPEDRSALSRTSKKIRACAEEARCIAIKTFEAAEFKKKFGSAQQLEDRIVSETNQLANLKFKVFNNQYSVLGLIVRILSCKACVMLRIMRLFFYIFPSLRCCAQEEINCKKLVREKELLISELRDIQAKFSDIQSFSESEIIELLGLRKEFHLFPRLEWTNPKTKEMDLDYLNAEQLRYPYTKGIDSLGRKFLIIRYQDKRADRIGLQAIYQSAKNSRFWKTLCVGQSLLQTSQETIDRNFIDEMKTIINGSEVASCAIF